MNFEGIVMQNLFGNTVGKNGEGQTQAGFALDDGTGTCPFLLTLDRNIPSPVIDNLGLLGTDYQ